MTAPSLSPGTLHVMSQLCYLDTVPSMYINGTVYIGALARYYLDNPLGKAYLSARFGGIPQEYELWKQFLDRDILPYKEWRITDIYNDNSPGQSGFYGCAFISPDDEHVVAFRGSELLGNPVYRNDYVTDLSLAYQCPTAQQKMVDGYWRRFGFPTPHKLYITGHSLGGNLAVYGATAAPAAIQKNLQSCYAFNAPGFCDDFAAQNKTGIAEVISRLFLVQNEYDLVSSLLPGVKEPLISSSLFNPWEQAKPTITDILYPHSGFMYKTDDNGDFLPAPSGEKCFPCRVTQSLSTMFLRLPLPLRKGICQTVLNALYTTPSPEKASRYMLESAIKYMAKQPFQDSEHFTETALAYSAILMEQSAISRPYGDLTKEDDIARPSAMSRTLLLLLEALRYACKPSPHPLGLALN